MGMLKKLAVVHALLCVGGVALAKDDPELIAFVLTQNAEAAKRIATLSYKSEYECDMDLGDAPAPRGDTGTSRGDRQGSSGLSGPPRGGRTHAEGREEVIQKGRLRWTSKQEHKVWETGGHAQDLHARTVVNNDYAAMWDVGQPYAYQFDHESIPSMSPAAATRLTLAGSRDSLQYAMGSRDRDYLQHYLETRETSRWEIEEKVVADSSSLFYVKEYSGASSDSSRPVSVLVIEPKKDFLVTHSTFYAPDGTIASEADVTPEKSKDIDIWLPKVIEEKQYRPARGTTPHENSLRKRLRIHITEVQTNPTIDDQQFTLEALQIPDRVKLVKRSADGFESVLVKRAGAFEIEAVAELVDRMAAMPAGDIEGEANPKVHKTEDGIRRSESAGVGAEDRSNAAALVEAAPEHGETAGWIVYYLIALSGIVAVVLLYMISRKRERRCILTK